MSIVSCPKCHDQVTVPASAPRSARVRCPLCQEEYDLADALAQLPPALIIVSASVADEPVLVAAGGMDAATGSEVGSAIDSGYNNHLEGGSGKGYLSHGFDAGAVPAEMVSAPAPTPAFRAMPRLRRKEKSMVGELIKIVLGGVVGIGLAIVILWWGPGVDLGLAPTIAKVSWMRWVLPQKILDQVEGNQGNLEENPDDLQPLNASGREARDKGDAQQNSEGKLGSDPRFEKALKSSEQAKASGKFGQSEDSQPAAQAKDSLDLTDPFAPDSSSSPGVGDLKIESPLSTQPKGATKKPEPAKAKPEGPEEKPAEEPVKKPLEEKPAEEKPAAKPEEPVETPPKESPPAAGNLAAGIDAANAAAKAFDDTDAADKDARKTAIVALYNAYAGLARTVEQVNLEDAENAEKLPALRQALEQAAADPVKLNSIGTLAARKLDEADGDPGILLAGRVKELKAAGGLFETILELVRDKRLVSVVSSTNPQDSYQVDDQVLILGAIVRDPKENLPGYKGDAAVVVKSGHAMILPMEKTP